MMDAGYWEGRYQDGNDPWDIGQPAPGLVAWLADHPQARGKALVVGCGPGHDAVAIAKHGFDVTAIDFAPTAVAETLQRAADAGVRLKALEAEAIHIIREVAAEFERPVLLFSGGKDSIVMLRLAEKAFWPARIPFHRSEAIPFMVWGPFGPKPW